MEDQSKSSLATTWNSVWSAKGSKSYSNLRSLKTSDKIDFLMSMGVDFRGKRVLDIGCGEGTALFYLHEKFGISGVGVDISDVVIKKNKQKSADYPGLNFFMGDHKALNLPDGEFDIVLSWGVVEHFEEYVHALGEARRVLKKGGLLVLIQPNLWSFGV